MPLTPDDLAYMRETQADHRPTEASLVPQASSSTPLGGRNRTGGTGVPIAIRIDSEAKIPESIATEFGVNVVRVTADLVPIVSGDLLVVADVGTFKVVSSGDTDSWTTAQRLWCVKQ